MLKELSSTDINDAADIFYNLFSSPPWNYDWIKIDLVQMYFKDIFNTPRSKSYCYYYNNNLVGVCFGNISVCSPIPIYEIKEIFVHNDFQHKGIGTKFLNEIEDDLLKINITAVKLSTLRTIPAFEYYSKNNYIVLDDSVNMIKILEKKISND